MMDWGNQDMISRTLLHIQRTSSCNLLDTNYIKKHRVPKKLVEIFPDMPRKKLIKCYEYWVIYYEREKERLT